MGGDVVVQLLEPVLNLRLPQVHASNPKQAVIFGLQDLLNDGHKHLVVLLQQEGRTPVHSPARQVEGEVQAQIVVVRGRVGPRISKHAIAMLPRAGAPILSRARIVVEGLRSTNQIIDGFHTFLLVSPRKASLPRELSSFQRFLCARNRMQEVDRRSRWHGTIVPERR